MPLFVDQLNREIEIPALPKRIISIVPSQTELLFYLGLEDVIIGITNFCVHPADKAKAVIKVGGTKKLNIDLIKTLKPDLIIANKEENDKNQVEELMEYFPVWISDINDLPGALEMIIDIGHVTDRQTASQKLANEISQLFQKLAVSPVKRRVAYLIWRKPYMVAGSGTFINSMLQFCGLSNVFEIDRYPEVSAEMLINAKPDVVLLSSEPYPFGDKHIEEFKAVLPDSRVMLVDGEMFSWYGSRLLYAPGYFNELLISLG